MSSFYVWKYLIKPIFQLQKGWGTIACSTITGQKRGSVVTIEKIPDQLNEATDKTKCPFAEVSGCETRWKILTQTHKDVKSHRTSNSPPKQTNKQNTALYIVANLTTVPLEALASPPVCHNSHLLTGLLRNNRNVALPRAKPKLSDNASVFSFVANTLCAKSSQINKVKIQPSSWPA